MRSRLEVNLGSLFFLVEPTRRMFESTRVRAPTVILSASRLKVLREPTRGRPEQNFRARVDSFQAICSHLFKKSQLQTFRNPPKSQNPNSNPISMAPKRQAAPPARGKRAVCKVVRRAAPSPSSSSSSSEHAAGAGSSTSAPNPMAGRTVTTGRKVNFDFLLREGFSFGIKIRNLGWEKLCSLDVPTYPALVSEFYASAGRGEGGLIGTVRGKTIKISKNIISSLLDMPTVGAVPQTHEDRAGALSAMLGREVGQIEEISANQLSVEHRLLHNIVGRVLFPKTGRFDFISEKDVVLMDCILNEHPINLPGMMVSYMGEACTKKKTCLPYGMVLTLAFRAQGVSISDAEPKRLLRHTDYYNESTLRRMGYRKVEGIWEKKGHDHQAPVLPSSPSAAAAPPPPALPASPPSPPPSVAAGPSAPPMTEDMFTRFSDMIKEEQRLTREHISQEQAKTRESMKEVVDRIIDLQASFQVNCMVMKDVLEHVTKKVDGVADCSTAYEESSAKLQVNVENASLRVESMLKEFHDTQKNGMGKILDQLKIIFNPDP